MHIPYISDQLSTIAKLALGHAAIIKVAYDLVSKHQSLPYETKLEEYYCCQEGHPPTIRWPEFLEPYFRANDPIRQRPQLRRNNPADLQISEFILPILEIALHDFRLVFKEELNKTPLYYFDRLESALKKGIQKEGKGRKYSGYFSRVCKSLTVMVPDGEEELARISFTSLNFDRNSKKISDENSDIIQRQFDVLVKQITNWMKDSFKDESVDINQFPGLRLDQSQAWLWQYSGVEKTFSDENNLSGIYYIIREARGAISNKICDVNLILRDVLWIRPLSEPLGFTPIDAFTNMNRGHKHGTKLGFYYSCMDHCTYEITRLSMNQNVISIDGIALFNNRSRTKSLSIQLPVFESHDLNFSIGTMMGSTAHFSRPAAWTIVASKPRSAGLDLENSDLILSMYADTLHRNTRENYDLNIVKLSEFIVKNYKPAVLSSLLMTQKTTDEFKDIADIATNNREAFYNMFKATSNHNESCNFAINALMLEFGLSDKNIISTNQFEKLLQSMLERQGTLAIATIGGSDIRERTKDAKSIQHFARILSRHYYQMPENYRVYEKLYSDPSPSTN